MESDSSKHKGGRPKKLRRHHVINISMMSYWTEGQSNVSINEICNRAEVSKPGLYREFKSEDGLKLAVLIEYQKMTLAPLYEMLAIDQHFLLALEALIEYILRDHQEHNMPNGCLFIDMIQCRTQLGALTVKQIDQFHDLSLKTYEKWIKRAKKNGQFKASISPKTAALYIDSQIACVMNLQRHGVAAKDLSAVFRLALSVLN